MGKASRTKRRRAAVRSAKRARNNNAWYALTALVVIAGIALVVYSKATQPAAVGPYVTNQNDASDPHNKDAHWHAALGVYDCDHWMGDGSGEGIWNWPGVATVNGQQSPGRVGTNLYAGLHSHDDGIIHMEPSAEEEAGKHATVGRYFDYGGWKLSSTGYDFLGTKVKDGDKCGNVPGTLQWEVAKFNGNVNGKQSYTVKTGNPGAWKLHNNEIVVIAFLPQGKTIDSIGNPPSLPQLPGATGRETAPGATTPAVNPTPTTGTSSTASPTTGASTATTKP
jgi:hypothetical protein